MDQDITIEADTKLDIDSSMMIQDTSPPSSTSNSSTIPTTISRPKNRAGSPMSESSETSNSSSTLTNNNINTNINNNSDEFLINSPTSGLRPATGVERGRVTTSFSWLELPTHPLDIAKNDVIHPRFATYSPSPSFKAWAAIRGLITFLKVVVIILLTFNFIYIPISTIIRLFLHYNDSCDVQLHAIVGICAVSVPALLLTVISYIRSLFYHPSEALVTSSLNHSHSQNFDDKGKKKTGRVSPAIGSPRSTTISLSNSWIASNNNNHINSSSSNNNWNRNDRNNSHSNRTKSPSNQSLTCLFLVVIYLITFTSVFWSYFSGATCSSVPIYSLASSTLKWLTFQTIWTTLFFCWRFFRLCKKARAGQISTAYSQLQDENYDWTFY